MVQRLRLGFGSQSKLVNRGSGSGSVRRVRSWVGSTYSSSGVRVKVWFNSV
ncbi:hypothetical protein Hanom_Chr04g00334781 [Helianthus anomalus]